MRVYTDSLTPDNIIKQTAKIKQAFPALPNEFYDILCERIKDKNFTDKRLIDSINNVIDTCIYPTPTIANFLIFDKTVKMYTYEQIIKLNNEYNGIMKKYKATKIPGANKPLWVHIGDIKKYDFKLWDEKNV
jgi:hypothetical protein